MEWRTSSLVAVICLFIAVSLPETKADSYNYKVLNSHDPTKYKDGRSLLRAGYNVTGVYRLSLNNTDVDIPIEFRNGNAFYVILRRVDPSIVFRQPWSAYEAGFGHPQGNYWAGLANIFHLTNTGLTKSLQVNMQDWAGVNQNAHYTFFKLGERNSRYRLNTGGYSGALPDDLHYHNGMPFSTYDAPDPYGCASSMYAGWWYNYCAITLPTGHYYTTPYYTPTAQKYDGIYYKDWHEFNYSLKFVSWTLHD